MRHLYLLTLATCISIGLQAQNNICNNSGNVFLYTNYNGGVLNINIDQNIANIKIGIVGYQAVAVNISGTYAGNVTEVRFAGYNSSGSNCGQTISTTTFSGTGSAATSVTFAPSSTLSNSNGYGSIICGYSCNTNTTQGGCNTVDQIEHYWLQQFSNGILYSHTVQYGCWTGTQTISSGGDCCALLVPLTAVATGVDESCADACNGEASVSAGGGVAPYSYLWSNGDTTANITGLCAGTYTVTVTDDNQTTAIDSVTIQTVQIPVTNQSFVVCSGDTVHVGNNSYYETGVFNDTLLSSGGCDSIVVTDLTVNQVYFISNTHTFSECEDVFIQVGNSTYTAPGTYVDSMQTQAGCDSIITTLITTFPVALISMQPTNESVTQGNNVLFEITTVANTNLQWQEDAGTGFMSLSNAGMYDGADSIKLKISNVPMSMDNYTYRCIVSDTACIDTSDVVSLNVKRPKGIGTISSEAFEWQIFPNPATDVLNISFDQPLEGELTINDQLGRTVYSQRINGTDYQVNISALESGVYFISTNSGGNTQSKSFSITR